jgi:mono/diheme cytochrome c family protein
VRRLAPFALLAVLAVLAALLAGCGGVPGGEVTTATPETVEGPLPQVTTPGEEVPPEYANGDPAAGRDVFISTGCGSCHTLDDAGTTGTIGPNLDESAPSLALAADRIANGRGGMPPYKEQLTDQQIADVAAYIVDATGGG